MVAKGSMYDAECSPIFLQWFCDPECESANATNLLEIFRGCAFLIKDIHPATLGCSVFSIAYLVP